MALKIRLSRGGSKKRPYYRVVVTDSRAPRDGRFIERLGTYNPLLPKDHAERVLLKEDRIKYWIGVGAQPSDRVARFLGAAEIIAMPAQRNNPQKSKPKAKALARAKEAEESKKAAEEAAKAPPPPPEPEAPEPEAPEPEVAVEEPVAEAPPEEVAPEAPAEEAPAEEAAAAEVSEDKG